MNTRVRTTLQTMKAPTKRDKEMEKEKKTNVQGSRVMNARKVPNSCLSRRDRKIALQQDVDKLRKKLRHEENVHRALERAFTRPLGALPRLPPYLPSSTLELLAEVAVLEEEVVRLEEQVVNFRQGLYQEAIYISSSKKSSEIASDLYYDRFPYQTSKNPEQSKPCAQFAKSESSIINTPASTRWCLDPDSNGPSSNWFTNGKRLTKNPNSCLPFPEGRCGKENHLNSNSTRSNKLSPQKKVLRGRMATPVKNRPDVQSESLVTDRESVEESFHGAANEEVSEEVNSPNKISEDILKCLLNIYSRMSLPKNTTAELEMSPSVSSSCESLKDGDFGDPYGICSEFGIRDIGPYKNLFTVEASSIAQNFVTSSSFLVRRLKLLLRKLALVDLSGLSHQQKLAFWINIYNSCMMNAYLEHGIPSSPQMVVAQMPKAMLNVGGYLLSAMTIEHFILRLPYHSKDTDSKEAKNEEMTTWGIFGLDWPEPLVTFALSCGSWSSPSVKVYTASQVENELETAKKDYLQAALGISPTNKLAIPKLLDWYLLDFAKDVESLMDWICLQLPSGLRDEAVKCLEKERRNPVPQSIQVLPYDFSFRYLFGPIEDSLPHTHL